MARKPMQDIVPKKSIRDIPVPAHRSRPVEKKKPEPEPVDEPVIERRPVERAPKAERRPAKIEKVVRGEEPEVEEQIPVHRHEPEEVDDIRRARMEFEESAHRENERRSKKGKRKLFLGLAIVVVIALAVLLSTVFHGATLTVTPRTLAATVAGDFIAKKNPSGTDLPYQIVQATDAGSESVRASGEKQVEKRATGTIVVYNNYSSSPQRLIKNTRFATPEGLIFRITDSVTVPGKKGALPGTVEATVLADEPGANYNVGLKDFTIPGFKGDPRYEGFYGRSKTPLAGGFVGTVKVIADADRAKAKADIESKLKDSLLKQIADKKTADQIFYDKAYSIDYKELPEETVSDTEVTIKEQGTISAAMFDRRQLSQAIARTTVKDYKGEPVVSKDVEALAFAPKGQLSPDADSMSFSLSGNATLEWLYDENALKSALIGKSSGETASILQKFPTIQKADISIRPFWSHSFPGSADKIAVKKAM